MNVLTKIRLINDLNDKELRLGVVNTSSSWHNQYRDSAWVYVGNLPYELSEGDVICVLSQYGEIVNINMIREKKTGKSKGFAFVCYEDQRSTVLAVDNLNGTKIKNRQLRVDHVLAYKVPKEDDDLDELTQKIHERGVAPDVIADLVEQQPTGGETSPQIVISDASVDETDKKKKGKKKLSFLKEKSTKKSSKLSKFADIDPENSSRKKKHRDGEKRLEENERRKINVRTEKRTFENESDSDQERKKKRKKKHNKDEERDVSLKKKSSREKEKRHRDDSDSDHERNESKHKFYRHNDESRTMKYSHERRSDKNEHYSEKKSHKKKYSETEKLQYDKNRESRETDYFKRESRNYDRSPDVCSKKRHKR